MTKLTRMLNGHSSMTGSTTVTTARRTQFKALGVVMTVAGVIPHVSAMDTQENRPTFRASVAIVPITAVVRDSRNRIVRDLTRDDFQVLENGTPRPIVDFRATDRAPLSLALLFDTSGSMRGPNEQQGKRILHRLLNAIDPAWDEVALFTFDKVVREETPFTSKPDVVRHALNKTDAWGLTSLYDAIAETANRLEDRPSQRRAVIVITDGLDTSSTRIAAEVSGLAGAIDVPVYIVAVVPMSRRESEAGAADGGLAYLAYWTGGDVKHVGAAEHVDQAIERLLAELRQQYFLAIESAKAAGWHRLEVRTKDRKLTARARTGYFATPAPRQGSEN